MILNADLPELAYFRKVEARSRFEISSLYENLVVASTNDRSAIHRWFRFKESFSADLLGTVLKELELSRKNIELLDPFCGVGTSLVAAQELRLAGYSINATGVERNPFIAFAAKTKTHWPKMNARLLRDLPQEMLKIGANGSLPLPRNSSFLTSRCMTAHTTKKLLQIAQTIRQHGSTPSHQALLLGLASAIEPLSRTRKDGRALRLVDKPKFKIWSVLAERWDAIVEDVTLMQTSLGKVTIPKVLLGDGRNLAALRIPANSQDLIFTSPPYPNNIDYTEVYKLELWLLGFVKSAEDFLGLRRQTFRSHPTRSNRHSTHPDHGAG